MTIGDWVRAPWACASNGSTAQAQAMVKEYWGVVNLFTYTASVTIRPEVLRPGTKAEGTATFSNVEGGRIARAYASYPLLGQTELTKRSENVYALSYTIPAVVPPGTYTAYVYAESSKGETGPRIAVRLTIAPASATQGRLWRRSQM